MAVTIGFVDRLQKVSVQVALITIGGVHRLQQVRD